MSQRELARRLVGPKATDNRVENERRQIGRYLSAETVPSPEKAERMAAILKVDASLFQDTESGTPRRLLDQIVALRELTEEISEMLEPDLDGRLAALEAKVDKQGKAQTKALKALEEGIVRLIDQLSPGVRRASGERS